MIILVTGPSSTGKTFLSQKLMETFSIPFFSIDWLKMGLYRNNPDIGFSPTENELTEKYLRPIIREMIYTVQENNQSIILEGIYITDTLLNELDNVLTLNIRFSEDYIRNHYSDILEYRSITELREEPETRSINEMIEEHNNANLEGAVNFLIEEDYLKSIDSIIKYVRNVIKEY